MEKLSNFGALVGIPFKTRDTVKSGSKKGL